MFAIEIKDLIKSFKGLRAVDGLTMKVPVGSIYGFIGENGSGKSTTEKLICGHLVPDGGTIKLFGKDYRDASVRAKVGALIENAGCFPNSSVYNNLKMQAINLGLKNSDEEIKKNVFDKFYQGDSSRSTEGNGLGLALVKKITEKIGGEISVDSEVGKGSEFTLKLSVD